MTTVGREIVPQQFSPARHVLLRHFPEGDSQAEIPIVHAYISLGLPSKTVRFPFQEQHRSPDRGPAPARNTRAGTSLKVCAAPLFPSLKSFAGVRTCPISFLLPDRRLPGRCGTRRGGWTADRFQVLKESTLSLVSGAKALRCIFHVIEINHARLAIRRALPGTLTSLSGEAGSALDLPVRNF